MDGNNSDIDWDTEDELEIENFIPPYSSALIYPDGEAAVELADASFSSSNSKVIDHFVGMGFSRELVKKVIEENGEENTNLILENLLKYPEVESSSPGSSNSKVIDHFVGMGFSEKFVVKAIQENGEENTDSILESILTYSALENSPAKQHVGSDPSSDYEGSPVEDFSDFDSFSETEEIGNPDSDETRLSYLKQMGYKEEEASVAIERCGPDSTLEELTDFICASRMAKATDSEFPLAVYPKPPSFPEDLNHKKRHLDYDHWNSIKQIKLETDGDEETLHLHPNAMTGFGVPSDRCLVTSRRLSGPARGPPYFYYENVAIAPKGVWDTMSRFLYDVQPEFVDSKHFCAAARKRGYIHNLPIDKRFPLVPLPPMTIYEAFPLTRKWWPSWDPRTQLNCLQTSIASAKLTEQIRKQLERHDGEPPHSVKKFVLEQCRKWNLVWVGRNKVAPLEPDEVEMLLGFPRNHTRGGISRTDRYKSLGNSFQVNTVAYHLSVLKDMYPGGINLLSLFSGIGGAEVALHKLGIPLKNVVSVEIFEGNRSVMSSWWEQTNQRGNLYHINDIQELTEERLRDLMSRFGGFDLVVGGSPCNNLAGSNRHHRDGLEGKESSLFFDYVRILDSVKQIMAPTPGRSN